MNTLTRHINYLKYDWMTWRRLPKLLYHTRKELIQLCRNKNNHKKTIVFIAGSERSGTTLMEVIFDKDLNTKIYGEYSELSSNDPGMIRLNELDLVKDVIVRDKFPLIISKPLAESQNLCELLDYFKNSKALWIYRNYKDVVSSTIKLFGREDNIFKLKSIVENRSEHWSAEKVPENVRKTVIELYSEDINPYDASALFWYVRNNLFFELNLKNNPNVMIFKYEDLINNSKEVMRDIYCFLDHPYPGDKIVSGVYSTSVGKGKKIKLSPEINILCMELWEKLDLCRTYNDSIFEMKSSAV